MPQESVHAQPDTQQWRWKKQTCLCPWMRSCVLNVLLAHGSINHGQISAPFVLTHKRESVMHAFALQCYQWYVHKRILNIDLMLVYTMRFNRNEFKTVLLCLWSDSWWQGHWVFLLLKHLSYALFLTHFSLPCSVSVSVPVSLFLSPKSGCKMCWWCVNNLRNNIVVWH